jgi:hypothetical protein
MGINTKNVVVSTVVGTLVSGLLVSNLNAITSTATYTIAKKSETQHEATQSLTATTPAAATASATHTNLDAWLDKLAEKESNNQSRIKILDVNGRYSYGCLQFQMATFKSYSARYGHVDPSTVTSWEELLYNCSLQKKVAKSMIKENSANWRHWGYTVLNKGVGLPPQTEEAIALAIAQ